MIILANLLNALAVGIGLILQLALIVIIVRAVVSWFNPDPYSTAMRILNMMTEPIIRPIRKRLPMAGGIDWSPIVAIVLIVVLQAFLVNTLSDYSIVMRRNAVMSSNK